MSESFYLISYDIADDKRRNRVAKRLEQVGERVQESVFELELSTMQHKRLVADLQAVITPQQDNLRIYQLCKRCLTNVQVQGPVPLSKTPDFYLV